MTVGLDTKLGDFTSEFIGPNVPVPIWSGQQGIQLTLANQDLINSVTIARRNNFVQNGPNTAQIPPLGSITVDGSRSIWALAPANTANLLIFPGGGNWAPSPAQVAAQINALGLAKDTSVNAPGYQPITLVNAGLLSTSAGQTLQNTTIPNNIAATGVPALNLKSTNTIASGQTVAAGVTANLTAITGINQPAYNLHITATAGGSSTLPWYTVTIKWVDTASGLTIQIDAYTAYMSSTSNVLSTVIYGPTDADQCQISVTNNDSVTMTINTAFFVLSSRTNYTADRYYQFWTSASPPPIPTFQLGNSVPVPTSKVLFNTSRSLGIGLTTSPRYALPAYDGQVYIHFDGTSSNNWDVVFFESVNGTVLFRYTATGAPAQINALVQFPRLPVSLQFTNNGSVSGNLNCLVVAE